MSFVTYVQPDKRLDVADERLDAFARLAQARSVIPAVTHLDCSARIQTVDRELHPRFHAILSAFAERTGCPVLINTSLNVRGQPIVNTVAEAYDCLMSTGMDALVVDHALVLRSEQSLDHRRSPAVEQD
jgi:carbamoyltransferase